MNEFKPGDKVVIRATVERAVDDHGDFYLRSDLSRRGFYATPRDLEPAPEPPYEDPELVPGMAVMSTDRSDKRMWHYFPDELDDDIPFYTNEGQWYSRSSLPEFRVVFDPRVVSEGNNE